MRAAEWRRRCAAEWLLRRVIGPAILVCCVVGVSEIVAAYITVFLAASGSPVASDIHRAFAENLVWCGTPVVVVGFAAPLLHLWPRLPRQSIVVDGPEAAALVARANHPFVLYLRSHSLEQPTYESVEVASATAEGPWPQRMPVPRPRQTDLLVAILSDKLARPALTLFNPADRHPSCDLRCVVCVGVAWQEVVAALADRSSLVLLALDRTGQGVLWEVELLARINAWSRTVVLMDKETTPDARARIPTDVPVFDIGLCEPRRRMFGHTSQIDYSVPDDVLATFFEGIEKSARRRMRPESTIDVA